MPASAMKKTGGLSQRATNAFTVREGEEKNARPNIANAVNFFTASANAQTPVAKPAPAAGAPKGKSPVAKQTLQRARSSTAPVNFQKENDTIGGATASKEGSEVSRPRPSRPPPALPPQAQERGDVFQETRGAEGTIVHEIAPFDQRTTTFKQVWDQNIKRTEQEEQRLQSRQSGPVTSPEKPSPQKQQVMEEATPASSGSPPKPKRPPRATGSYINSERKEKDDSKTEATEQAALPHPSSPAPENNDDEPTSSQSPSASPIEERNHAEQNGGALSQRHKELKIVKRDSSNQIKVHSSENGDVPAIEPSTSREESNQDGRGGLTSSGKARVQLALNLADNEEKKHDKKHSPRRSGSGHIVVPSRISPRGGDKSPTGSHISHSYNELPTSPTEGRKSVKIMQSQSSGAVASLEKEKKDKKKKEKKKDKENDGDRSARKRDKDDLSVEGEKKDKPSRHSRRISAAATSSTSLPKEGIKKIVIVSASPSVERRKSSRMVGEKDHNIVINDDPNNPHNQQAGKNKNKHLSVINPILNFEGNLDEENIESNPNGVPSAPVTPSNRAASSPAISMPINDDPSASPPVTRKGSATVPLDVSGESSSTPSLSTSTSGDRSSLSLSRGKKKEKKTLNNIFKTLVKSKEDGAAVADAVRAANEGESLTPATSSPSLPASPTTKRKNKEYRNSGNAEAILNVIKSKTSSVRARPRSMNTELRKDEILEKAPMQSSPLAGSDLSHEEGEEPVQSDEDEDVAVGKFSLNSPDSPFFLPANPKRAVQPKQPAQKDFELMPVFAPKIVENILPEDESLLPEQRKRNKVINEIINTERDYVKDLQLITDVYMTPLKSASSKESSLLTSAQINLIFAHINLIHGVNTELLNSLTKNAEESNGEQIAVSFLSLIPILKMYSQYCANQTTVLETIDAISKKSSAFRNFLEDKQFNCPETRGQSLSSFLIKPVQRICRYPLLLRELSKLTPVEHPDYENISNAINKIELVVTQINEGKKKLEMSQVIFDIQNRIEGAEGIGLLTPTRKFIKESPPFKLFDPELDQFKDVVLFLFNDAILPTVAKGGVFTTATGPMVTVTSPDATHPLLLHLHQSLPMEDSSNSSLGEGLSNMQKMVFEMRYHQPIGDAPEAPQALSTIAPTPVNPELKKKVIMFMCHTPENKTTWMNEIKAAYDASCVRPTSETAGK